MQPKILAYMFTSEDRLQYTSFYSFRLLIGKGVKVISIVSHLWLGVFFIINQLTVNDFPESN